MTPEEGRLGIDLRLLLAYFLSQERRYVRCERTIVSACPPWSPAAAWHGHPRGGSGLCTTRGKCVFRLTWIAVRSRGARRSWHKGSLGSTGSVNAGSAVSWSIIIRLACRTVEPLGKKRDTIPCKSRVALESGLSFVLLAGVSTTPVYADPAE